MRNSNLTNSSNSSPSHINLSGEFSSLEQMMYGSNSNSNNNNSGFDNNPIVVSDDEDDENDRLNELIGSYDQPKKKSSLSENDVLLADPYLVSQPLNNSNNNASNNENSGSSSLTPSIIPSSNPNSANSNSNSANSGNDPNNSSDPNPNVGLPANLENPALPSGNNVIATAKPGGFWNQRFLVVGACIAVIIITAIFHNTSGKTAPKTNSDDLTTILPAPEASPRMADPGLRTYELGMPEGKLPTNKSSKRQEELPEIVIPKEVTPAPVPKTEPTPLPAPTPEPVEEPEDFAIKFRAANKLAAQSLIDKSRDKGKEEAKETASVLEGLRIPMQLIEPLRSGIPTNVSAVVIADVKDGSGNTVVPKGSRVQIPFLAFEVQGRVTNDISANSVIVLANNKKLALKGIVKGVDGFAGLKGKVKQQSKGNLLARTGKAIGKVGARVIGVQTGGIGGFVVEDTINESINTSLPFVSNQRIVEVMAGTPFTFNVN